MNPAKNRIMLFVTLMIGTLTQMCTDMYTPSIPAISQAFHSSVGQAQLTMTWLLLGIVVTGLIYGPLSEVIGRRYTILLGVGISLTGTLLCGCAHTLLTLQIGRLIEGIGLGACATLWRSILRDSYSGKELASISSFLTNVIILSVIVAPLLGGYFQQYLSWRVTFIFLFVWSVFIMYVVYAHFKETGKHHGRHRLNIGFIRAAYAELFRSKTFLGYSLCALLSYGGLFSWITVGSTLLIHGAGIQPVTFGWLTILFGGAMALGGTVNGKWVKRLGTHTMIQVGWSLMFIAGVILLVTHLWFGITVMDIVIPVMLFIFAASFIFPNVFAGAFHSIGHIAGYGGALYSSIQLAGGMLFSAVLSHLSSSSSVPLAWTFMLSGGLSWGFYRVLLREGNITR